MKYADVSFGGALRSDDPPGALAEDQVNRDKIRLPEKFLFGDRAGAGFGRLLGCQVLAPGDHVHGERPA